ncbi:MAG: hypothetical protein JWN50_693 [Parcubacteria group bacterium]|nr:hypothetical protein [Parcubacteria group bacterium]
MKNSGVKNIAIGIFLILAIFAAAFIIKKATTSSTAPHTIDTTDTVLAQPTAKESVIMGKLNCLSFKSGEAVTDDNCVMGLISDDGKSYALDTTKLTIISKTLAVKDEVRAVGVLSAPNSSTDEGTAFAVSGVLQARAIQKATQ